MARHTHTKCPNFHFFSYAHKNIEMPKKIHSFASVSKSTLLINIFLAKQSFVLSFFRYLKYISNYFRIYVWRIHLLPFLHSKPTCITEDNINNSRPRLSVVHRINARKAWNTRNLHTRYTRSNETSQREAQTKRIGNALTWRTRHTITFITRVCDVNSIVRTGRRCVSDDTATSRSRCY